MVMGMMCACVQPSAGHGHGHGHGNGEGHGHGHSHETSADAVHDFYARDDDGKQPQSREDSARIRVRAANSNPPLLRCK